MPENKEKQSLVGLIQVANTINCFCFVLRFLLFVTNRKKSLIIIECPCLTAKAKKNSLLGKKEKFIGLATDLIQN